MNVTRVTFLIYMAYMFYSRHRRRKWVRIATLTPDACSSRPMAAAALPSPFLFSIISSGKILFYPHIEADKKIAAPYFGADILSPIRPQTLAGSSLHVGCCPL